MHDVAGSSNDQDHYWHTLGYGDGAGNSGLLYSFSNSDHYGHRTELIASFRHDYFAGTRNPTNGTAGVKVLGTTTKIWNQVTSNDERTP